ncbi:GNAT family N-acetyltransferase [Alkalihalobacterium elongatum]|uniref:GNAT family N-acetyltransferase n=1 Tax=Alkalihalobacterium elongatum TaxID=2675466 RepID=UPI001C1FFAA6|nr:GNAT family N-acetyltransferase [Alkalihalobacterium elongatum]
MGNETVIRKATSEDIIELQKIAKETWHHTYEGLIPRDVQDQFIASAYSHENLEMRIIKSLFLVASVDNNVIGFANFFIKNTYANLGAIYIYPYAQGKGIGSNLLIRGIDELKNVPKIYVEVEAGNDVGETFYKAKGFQLVEEYDDEVYGHTLKTKRLVLNL